MTELVTRLEHEGQQSVRLNSSAIDSLKLYHWPGNVRELTNLIERLSLIHEGKIVGLNELPVEYRVMTKALDLQGGKNDPEQNTEQKKAINSADITAEATIAEVQADLEKPLEEKAFLKIMSPLTAENLTLYLQNFEKELILSALEDSAGIEKFAIQRLNLEEQTFQEKLQKYSIK